MKNAYPGLRQVSSSVPLLSHVNVVVGLLNVQLTIVRLVYSSTTNSLFVP